MINENWNCKLAIFCSSLQLKTTQTLNKVSYFIISSVNEKP